jgi:recombination protein RecA
LTLGQIEKQFGKGSVLPLGSKEAIVPVATISSGFISLDYALGAGGLPIYAKKLGVNVDNLLVSQPDYAEQALERMV